MKNYTSFKIGMTIAAVSVLAACASNTGTTSSNGTFNDVAERRETAIEPTQISSRQQSEYPMRVYLTGYSYWDNTPRGSAQIARPFIHRSAGGTGTYADPVTLAVGHVKRGQTSVMDYPTGTRFYIKKLRKYAVVEDLCGDGPTPQNGPCHSGHQGYDWIDIYVGGKGIAESSVNRCMYRITGVQDVILNPSPGYPVAPGEIAASGCAVF